jgi:putative hemolysin
MDFVLIILHLQKAQDQTITEEEISHALDLGRIAGLVEPDEQRIVKRVLQFGDRQAHSIMTPRPNVIWLDIELPINEILKTITDNPFSRYPVMRGSPDNIVGIVNARDILRFMEHQVNDFNFLIQEPLFIVKHLSVLSVVDIFREHPLHFALVIDEYGGFMGIITPYDILQALIGELPVGHVAPGIRKSKFGNWYIDGSIPIQEFKLFFDIDEFPEEYRYGTLSGFIMHALGHIPSTGEHFDWNGFNFTVVSMVRNSVNEVVVNTPENKSS